MAVPLNGMLVAEVSVEVGFLGGTQILVDFVSVSLDAEVPVDFLGGAEAMSSSDSGMGMGMADGR